MAIRNQSCYFESNFCKTYFKDFKDKTNPAEISRQKPAIFFFSFFCRVFRTLHSGCQDEKDLERRTPVLSQQRPSHHRQLCAGLEHEEGMRTCLVSMVKDRNRVPFCIQHMQWVRGIVCLLDGHTEGKRTR